MFLKFTIPGPPMPSVRIRTRRGQFFMDPKSRAYMMKVQMYALQHKAKLLNGDLGLILDFYLPDNRGRDFDNLAKGVTDPLNKDFLFHDDRQIQSALIRKHLDRENPRAEVSLFTLADVCGCPTCGK